MKYIFWHKRILYIFISIFCTWNAFAEIQIQQGRSGSMQQIKMKSSGVPAFEFYARTDKRSDQRKVQNIPLLDIGSESKLSFSGFTALAKLPLRPILNIAKKETPDVLLPKNIQQIEPVGISKNKGTSIAIPTVNALKEVAQPELQNPNPELIELHKMNTDDFKLLEALIFLDIHQDYELTLGLLAELMKVKNYQDQIQYHYARTALGLKLHSEFRFYILKVAEQNKNKTFKDLALEQAAINFPALKWYDVERIDKAAKNSNVNLEKVTVYQLARAKYYLDNGDLTLTSEALDLIPEKSDQYIKSLLLSAIFEYRRGQLNYAIDRLQKLLQLTEADKKSQLRGVAAITLGRILFQKGEFKSAYQNYLQVDKDHPLWLEAMTETAWAQILVGDYEGAAGNMFSLHTDFFKNAFAPESYIIRTVGYLNLCQFGDSIHALEMMKRRYTPWKLKIESFLKNKPSSEKYYDLVRLWLRNTKLSEVDGVPRSFIIELARHPVFLDMQTEINEAEDEKTRYNEVSLTLVRKEKEASLQQQEVLQDITKLQKQKSEQPSLADKISQDVIKLEKKLAFLKVQQQLAKIARNSIKDVRTVAIDRLEKEKNQYKEKTGNYLSKRYSEMLTELNRVLDQTEILQYEVFSGAGEHIRYQMAGGAENDGYRAELKPDKHIQWKFKGEIWEDEVGHYRSSLKNVCAAEDNNQKKIKN